MEEFLDPDNIIRLYVHSIVFSSLTILLIKQKSVSWFYSICPFFFPEYVIVYLPCITLRHLEYTSTSDYVLFVINTLNEYLFFTYFAVIR